MTFLPTHFTCRALLAFGLALAAGILGSGPARAQETAYPEVEKFATAIKGTIWELRGTNTLKRLRYDDNGFVSLNRQGKATPPYETAFVDVGVVRLNFPGANSGWYFFSDDLKYVSPTTISGELVFKLSDSSTPKPIKNFPADIEGQVWDSVQDERKISPARMRWNGKEMEFGVLRDNTWDVNKHPVVVAERRVLEKIVSSNTIPAWYVFSADGTEAWQLSVEAVFGGISPKVTPKAGRTMEQTGLTQQQNDLANFAEDLVPDPAQEKRLDTIRRQLNRSLVKQPDVAKATHQRLGGK